MACAQRGFRVTAGLEQTACEPGERLSLDIGTNAQREGFSVVGYRLRFPPIIVVEEGKVVVGTRLRMLCRRLVQRGSERHQAPALPRLLFQGR